MPEIFANIMTETWSVLYEASLYVLVGFFFAGVLQEFMSTASIARHLGGDNARSVLMAAVLGAPIPLCSCGVLPTTAALKQKGASRPSLLSFLISTPETGLDSIAITYGLLGPVMAIVRPVVAVVTGFVAGAASIVLGNPRLEASNPQAIEAPGGSAPGSATSPAVVAHAGDAADGAACSNEGCGCGDRAPVGSASPDRDGWLLRWQRSFHYGFRTLLDDIAFWLVIGILLTGVLSALLPEDFFSNVLGWDRGLLPMLAMIVAGVPLYLCASASTPIAAALIAKGLSPGAALVFLLVGPATNAATMTVVGKLLGARQLWIYLLSIIIVALGAGLLLDVFAADVVRARALHFTDDTLALEVIKIVAAVVLVFLMIASFRRTRFEEGREETRERLLGIAKVLRLPVRSSAGESHRSR